MKTLFSNSQKSVILIGLLWFAAINFALYYLNEYQVLILGTVAISAIAGFGLNVLLGLSGQISLGHAAFYAIGAYTASILSMTYNWSYWLSSLAALLVSASVGVVLSLPGLRLRGPYLAMVTIAFGLFVEQGIANFKDLTGGWNGLMGIPQPNWFNAVALSPKDIVWVAGLLSTALVIGFNYFSTSRWGRMMRASKDSEIASESLGIQIVWIRVMAFSISTAITGLGGAMFATLNSFISPESFPFFQSIIFLLIVLIGGRNYAAGPLLGALVVVLLPESISFLAEYKLMFFGVMLMLVLWLAPNGLSGVLVHFYDFVIRLLRPSQIKSSDLVSPWTTESDFKLENTPHSFKDSLHPTGTLLQIKGLGIHFGGNYALSNVHLTIESCKITSLIGPNGAGKTTLINILSGFYQPGEGEFKLGEVVLSGLQAYEIGRSRIARTFQTPQLFDEMSVFENVRVATDGGTFFKTHQACKHNSRKVESADALSLELLKLVGFKGNPKAKASSLAHVDRRLVEIARALATDPIFILLDEPAAGLSKEESKELSVLLKNIKRSGIGILLIEHDMSLVMEVSDCIHVLAAGRLIASGAPSQIQDNEQVKKAYLGDGAISIKDLDQSSNALFGSASIQEELPERFVAKNLADLSIQHLTASYGAAAVLSDINLNVTSGQCISVLGPNGAGKSTFMRSISGLHSQKTGLISWRGQDISQLPAHEIAGLGLTLIPEGRQVFADLTVDDNIRLGAYSRNDFSNQELEVLYAIFPPLLKLKNQLAGSLSGGEQQMLAFARGLAAKPQLLMLDEPTLGLAPAIVKDLFLKLVNLRRRGMTLLLVDQMAGLAMALSDYSYLLSAGETVFSGSPSELLDSGLLEQTYLENHA